MAEFPSWRSYWSFARSVSRELRYVRRPEDDEFLELVLATSETRHVEIKAGAIFWRAQAGHDWREEGEGEGTFEVECAHPRNRMKPPSGCAFDGRVNSKGIPCLYLATQKETAICEVRPWIGSLVSVAQFKIARKLKVVDFGHDDEGRYIYFEEPQPEKREKAVWIDINQAFSEPMTRDDDRADYVPTQIIAEMFKREGFDGVVYKSSFGEAGYNIALFDLGAADLVNCGLEKVDKISIEFSPQDSPYFDRRRDGK